jgi:type IV pilus assembly protein PilW
MGRSRKTNQSVDNHSREIAGVSLLELLIGLVLASLVATALYELLTSQHRSYSLQDDASEVQQNLRVAIERISRDLTMAGFGKPTWSTINGDDLSAWYNSANAYLPIRPGANLDIVGCMGVSDGTIASMDLTVTPATIALNEPATKVGENFNATTRSDISIGGQENTKVTGVSGRVLTVHPKPANTYAAGTEVYVVRHTTYSTGTSSGVPALLVNEHVGDGKQALCQFITDLDATVSGNSVTVTLTGRTRNPDRTTGHYLASTVSTVVLLRNP